MTEIERSAIICRLEDGCSFADEACEVVDIVRTEQVMRMAADYIDDDGKRIAELEAKVEAAMLEGARLALEAAARCYLHENYDPRTGGFAWDYFQEADNAIRALDPAAICGAEKGDGK